MVVEHRVTPVEQATHYSCWWACFRMLLTHRGIDDPVMPSRYSFEFNPPVFRAPNPLGDVVYFGVEQFLRHGSGRVETMSAPWEWYRKGVPVERRAVTELCRITGMQRLPRTMATGHWTIEFVSEVLQSYGPFCVIGKFGRRYHAYVVYKSTDHDVYYYDPSISVEEQTGEFERAYSIEFFNQTFTGFTQMPLNPLYLHESRARRQSESEPTYSRTISESVTSTPSQPWGQALHFT